uniref:Putative synaptic vesicle glycoprotein 2b n=1 Tax=Xenopsylla cheopis TaxID=163159 RepID=A0A6M2DWR6_XENCH
MPTLFIAFLCTLASSFANSVWLFILLRYFNGFFVSGGSATIYAYLGEFHNPRHRSRAIMGASSIFGFACLALPAIAWLIIKQQWSYYIDFLGYTYKPWRLYMVACGLPSLLCSIALWKLPESPKFLINQGKNEEARKIIAKMYRINTGKSESEFPVSSILDEYVGVDDESASKKKKTFLRTVWNQTAPLFMGEHLKKTIIACTLQFGIFATSNGMYMWFPDIISKMTEFENAHPGVPSTICYVVTNSSMLREDDDIINMTNNTVECKDTMETQAFMHSLILEAGYAIGFPIIGAIINTVGKLPILVFVMVTCGVCGILCAFIQHLTIASYLYLWLLVCGIAVTVVNAALVDLYPTQLRAMAVCISLMMGRLGSVVGSNVVGIILNYNCDMTFLISGTSLIACGVIAFFIPNIYKKPMDRRTSIASYGP